MLVKIKKGSYGYRDGNKIIPKTPKDEAFEVTQEQADRLVKKGVAEIISNNDNEYFDEDDADDNYDIDNEFEDSSDSEDNQSNESSDEKNGENKPLSNGKKAGGKKKTKNIIKEDTPPQLDPIPPVES